MVKKRTRRATKGQGATVFRGDTRNGRFVTRVYLTDAQGITKRFTFSAPTEAEVEAKRSAKEAELNAQGAPEGGWTVEAWLSYWMNNIVAIKTKRSTQYSYKQLIRLHIVPEFPNRLLVDLTAEHVQNWINRLIDKGLSGRTVQYCRAILRMTLKQAWAFGHVDRNVAAVAHISKSVASNIPEAWSLQESKEFIKYIKDERYFPLILTSLYTGCRKGELLALKWENVDLENKKIYIRQTIRWDREAGKWEFTSPKSKESNRVVNITDDVVEALKLQREKQGFEKAWVGNLWEGDKGETAGLVFATKTGLPISQENLTHRFNNLVEQSGIRRIRYHDIRHSNAPLLRAAGVTEYELSKWLGHSQISVTTKYYGHLYKETLEDAATKLQKLMNE